MIFFKHQDCKNTLEKAMQLQIGKCKRQNDNKRLTKNKKDYKRLITKKTKVD